MEWGISGLIILIGLLFLLALGMPIAFSMGFLSTVGIVTLLGPKQLYMLGQTAYTTPNSYVLTAIPMFILMAEVLTGGAMTDDLFNAANKWLGRFRGGLALSSVVACAIFAALTGSSAADTAAMGKVCVPEMMKRGYDKRLATGSVCAGGALGILIPPSILMIIYGSLTDQSIARLFIGGVFPGILLTALFMAYILLVCKFKPHFAPDPERGIPWKDKLRSALKIWWVLALLLLIMGTIYAGICTPTEAAACGCVGAVALTIIQKKGMNWKELRTGILRTVRVTCMVLIIMVGAMIFGYFLTHLGIPQGLVKWVTQLQVSRWVVMIAINLLLIGLGCILDVPSIIMITIPILYPVITALGFDPIWFGIVVTMNMEMANITPPMGLNLFVMRAIVPEVKIGDIIMGVFPFICIQALGLALVLGFPQLALWLPNTMR